MSKCISKYNIEDKTVSVRLTRHAEEENLRQYRINESYIVNEIKNLPLDFIEYLSEYYGGEPVIINNVERSLSIVIRVDGYTITVITVIIGDYIGNSDTSSIKINNEGEVISMKKLDREIDKVENDEGGFKFSQIAHI